MLKCKIMHTSITVSYFIQPPMVVYGTPFITGNYRYLASASKPLIEDSIGILKVTQREFDHITN